MKKDMNIRPLVELAAMPVAQIVLGLILLINPDGAISVVCRILGWMMVAVGLFFVGIFVTDKKNRDFGTILMVLGFGGCGAFLVKNPLVLAVGTGKIIGILLGIWGVSSLVRASRVRESGGSYILRYVFGCVTMVAGIWLLIAPMTPSRLIFALVGLWLIGAAAAKLFSLRSDLKALANPEKPKIIDADE